MEDEAPEIGPMPTPQQINVGQVVDQAGRKFVVLQFTGPNGMWVSFLSPEHAKAIGNQILSACSGGLVVASADQMPGQSPLSLEGLS